MSTLIVEVCKISDIIEHPGADRLEIAIIKGWQTIIPIDTYNIGDKVVYLPIDSILPQNIEEKLFPEGSKIKLNKSRIKTIKIRGAISQGMLASLESLELSDLPVGTDVKNILKIEKYEPIKKSLPKGTRPRAAVANSNFHKYTNIENIKNYPDLFQPDDFVYILEKIHGTNYRLGYVSYDKISIWKWILQKLNLLSNQEFVFGSHNVQLQHYGKIANKFNWVKNFYDKNIHYKTVKQYDLENKIPKNTVIYGEIYGSGIQGNYTYGCKEGETKLVVFDIKVDGKYLDIEPAMEFCSTKNLRFVPTLYIGYFKDANLEELMKDNSLLHNSQKMKEGAVIRPVNESASYMGRKILKYINPEYLLLKGNTDFH